MAQLMHIQFRFIVRYSNRFDVDLLLNIVITCAYNLSRGAITSRISYCLQIDASVARSLPDINVDIA